MGRSKGRSKGELLTRRGSGQRRSPNKRVMPICKGTSHPARFTEQGSKMNPNGDDNHPQREDFLNLNNPAARRPEDAPPNAYGPIHNGFGRTLPDGEFTPLGGGREKPLRIGSVIAFVEGLGMSKFKEPLLKKRSSSLKEVNERAYKISGSSKPRRGRREDTESVPWRRPAADPRSKAAEHPGQDLCNDPSQVGRPEVEVINNL
ncbi:hypothetical protein LIER_41875 [Lithospermum erythrorhizon]|uniref:Uncharacterized protein n=1 Tax=Lithospermum erythrorhizon TaxID=34254 RepID=A0AAV3RHD3_LITER